MDPVLQAQAGEAPLCTCPVVLMGRAVWFEGQDSHMGRTQEETQHMTPMKPTSTSTVNDTLLTGDKQVEKDAVELAGMGEPTIRMAQSCCSTRDTGKSLTPTGSFYMGIMVSGACGHSSDTTGV